ncbi:hypothetical protein DL96DRAFT_727486 [Flagelloscypha sp. PMI_526]|nr:hypothetical protein DL96DRAFT_727486 [Flagelloscypha sp. PMI_526]
MTPKTLDHGFSVAKRAATLGLQTFHLYEIYGLSSTTSNTTVEPTTPLPKSQVAADDDSGEHMDPPTFPVVPTAIAAHEEETTSQCLLCLSSPREVVLLPCRYLVACRECTVNMVEFGAGGSITQPADDTPAAEEMPPPPLLAAPTCQMTQRPIRMPRMQLLPLLLPWLPLLLLRQPERNVKPTDSSIPSVVNVRFPVTLLRSLTSLIHFFKAYSSLLRITTQPPPPPEVKKLEEEDNGAAEGSSAGGGILGSITVFRWSFVNPMVCRTAPLPHSIKPLAK